MFKTVLNMYKIPLLISLTLFIVLLALRVEREALNIILLLFGSLAGPFLLDIDYLLYAYFTEPEKDFSVTLKGFIKHKDFAGALNHIYYHKNEIKEKTLNSALFQIAVGLLLIFIISSNASLLIKALVTSAFVNSIWRMIEEYHQGDIKDWFWAININVTKKTVTLYSLALLAVLAYALSLI